MTMLDPRRDSVGNCPPMQRIGCDGCCLFWHFPPLQRRTCFLLLKRQVFPVLLHAVLRAIHSSACSCSGMPSHLFSMLASVGLEMAWMAEVDAARRTRGDVEGPARLAARARLLASVADFAMRNIAMTLLQLTKMTVAALL